MTTQDDGRASGYVRSIGARFGFIRCDDGEDYWFACDRLPPGLRLWPNDRVVFYPLLRTATTSTRPGGRPIAARIAKA